MVYYSFMATTAPASITRRLRLERLIGTDDTRGLRGDLARAFRARELGHTTGANGMPIDAEIASLAHGLAVHGHARHAGR